MVYRSFPYTLAVDLRKKRQKS